jgi:hypothetical protein
MRRDGLVHFLDRYRYSGLTNQPLQGRDRLGRCDQLKTPRFNLDKLNPVTRFNPEGAANDGRDRDLAVAGQGCGGHHFFLRIFRILPL